jgi:hypothetical protein
MDRQNQIEDDSDSVTEITVHNNGLTSDFVSQNLSKKHGTVTNVKKWKPSMGSEVMNFLNRKAWTKVTRARRENRKENLKVKWVFKKKDEQDVWIRYKSRIVTKGYLQIPGVDYTESFAPVATDNDSSTARNSFIHRKKIGRSSA